MWVSRRGDPKTRSSSVTTSWQISVITSGQRLLTYCPDDQLSTQTKANPSRESSGPPPGEQDEPNKNGINIKVLTTTIELRADHQAPSRKPANFELGIKKNNSG